ncbi:MAG: LysR family transcriptional regulator [Candidatus Dormibacteraceae bacterium]
MIDIIDIFAGASSTRRFAFTPEQMLAFISVADSRSVTAAAALSHLSQSTVSHHLKAFEQALGLRLFERVGRRLIPTEAAREIIIPVRSALQSLRDIGDAALALGSVERGQLRIGASQTTASHHLPRVLAAFLAPRPRLHIEVDPGNSSEVCQRVAAAELDLGLIEGPVTVPGLLERKLVRDEVVLVVAGGHPLAHRKSVTRRDLLAVRYLAREAGSGTEVLAEQALGQLYHRVDKLQLGQMDVVRAAVRAGLGFAALPRIALRDEIESGAIVVLPLATRWRWMRAIRRSTPAGPALEALWEELLTHVWAAPVEAGSGRDD